MSEEKPSHPLRNPAQTEGSTSFSVVGNKLQSPEGVVVTRDDGSVYIGPLPAPAILKQYQDISAEIVPEIIKAFSERVRTADLTRVVYKGGVIRSILGVVFRSPVAKFHQMIPRTVSNGFS